MKKALVIALGAITLSCGGPTIDNKDFEMVKCVVDSVWEEKPISTLQIESKWYHTTSCGKTIITTGRPGYSVGDTITVMNLKRK